MPGPFDSLLDAEASQGLQGPAGTPAPQGPPFAPFAPMLPSQAPLGFMPGAPLQPWTPASADPFARWPLWLPAFGPAQPPASTPVTASGGEADPLDAHHAVLDDTLRALDVPAKIFDMRERNAAATLMANVGIEPPAAIEHAVLRNLVQQGHFTKPEFDDIYGEGAFHAISGGPTSQGGAGAADQGGAPQRPGAAPGDDRANLSPAGAGQAGASFGDGDPAVGPASNASAPRWAVARLPSIVPEWSATAAPPGRALEPVEQGDFKAPPPIQAQASEGRETGPSDSLPQAAPALIAPAHSPVNGQPTGSEWLKGVNDYLRDSADGLSRIPQGVASMARDLVTDPLEFLHSADPGLAGLGMSLPAGAARAAANGFGGLARAVTRARSAYRSPPPETLAIRRARQLLTNKAKGAKFELKTAQELEPTIADLAPQITLRTKKSGIRVRVDLMGRDRRTGKTVCIDCKSSTTARLTPRQKQGFPEIEESGANVVGEGKRPYTEGFDVEPNKVRIIRPGEPQP